MKQSLQLRLGQQLSMTPQLQQAIKLLQLSSLDLQTEIQQAVESNPLLEFEEPDNDVAASPVDQSDTNNSSDEVSDIEAAYATGGLDSQWPTSFNSSSNFNQSDKPTDFPASAQSLYSHLSAQINVIHLSDTDRLIADTIIDAINDDGYLIVLPEEIHASFHEALDITLEEVMAVLNMIQHLDPLGIGARDLQDCLRIQLEQQVPDDEKIHALASQIIRSHFQLLSHRDYAGIAKQLKTDSDSIQQAVQLIQQLNPRPGNAIEGVPTEYITPDVLVRKIKGRWLVILNGDIAPQIKVNDYYASLIKRADNSRDNQFLKNNLQEARWFLKSLSNRNDTLLKVASLIVEQQQDFLEHGEEHMKPMVLRDIAEVIDMHESTISRVTTQKYMHTPRGIFELKYFFSSHVSTASGGECSSTAIRAMIKKLITDEDDRKPFSDNKLAQLLEQRGIKVARRTIAKYRESLLIPPSNERRLRA
ncbi:MAG: RNA polymerase factor sigma-54 [Gammaproteobacteria bacterium]|nr:RNA polymerase factor sigma-54 [Gammaproteobacteria bacterium]